MSQSGRFINGTGAAPIETLTGNAGGPVGPDSAGNIDLLGGNNITTTGNPGTNTVTIDVTGTTDHAVQIGNASGSLTSVALGNAGEVLTSNGAGADPSFQPSSGGITSITGDAGGAQTGPAITLTGGSTGAVYTGAANTITMSFAGITANGGTVNLGTDNAANAITIGTGTTGRLINIGLSAAPHTIVMGNTNTTTSMSLQSGTGNTAVNSAGTSSLTGTGGVSINSISGAINIGDGANANAINIGTGAAARTITVGNTTGATDLDLRCGTGDFTLASATGTIISALDTGEINYPLQPAFLAYQGTNGTDVTGNGAVYTLAIDTEIFDQNSDFNTGTFTFTAPVTGRYAFQAVARLQQLAAGMNLGTFLFVTSNRSYETDRANYGVIFEANTGNATYDAKGSILTDMDAADTCTVTVTVSGGAAAVDVIATTGTAMRTWFSGYLVA